MSWRRAMSIHTPYRQSRASYSSCLRWQRELPQRFPNERHLHGRRATSRSDSGSNSSHPTRPRSWEERRGTARSAPSCCRQPPTPRDKSPHPTTPRRQRSEALEWSTALRLRRTRLSGLRPTRQRRRYPADRLQPPATLRPKTRLPAPRAANPDRQPTSIRRPEGRCTRPPGLAAHRIASQQLRIHTADRQWRSCGERCRSGRPTCH